MAKKEKLTAPEMPEIGKNQQVRAFTLATKLDKVVMGELDRLAKAREDWEGGRFEVMFKLTSFMSPEDLDNLPHPRSETGNNPAHYLVEFIKINDKGERKSEWKSVYFYTALTDNLPGVVAMRKQISQLERSLGDDEKVNKSDIPEEYMNWTPDYRRAMIKKLNRRISSAETNVVGAFELFHQFKRLEDKAFKNVEAYPIYALGSDGSLCDGEEGRPFKVEDTTTPIMLRSKIKGREAIDSKMITVGSFLRYDLDKAEENGGTYQSIIDTTKRTKPDDEGVETVIGNAQDQSRPQSIVTVDTMHARLRDINEYLSRASEDRDRTQWQAIDKEVHTNDEIFVDMYEVYSFLHTLIGSPRDQEKGKKLVAELNEAAAA